MELDEEACLCFHVTKRKVLSFLRIEKPRRVAQLSECFGAGTGCGWCRAYLKHLFDAHQAGNAAKTEDPTSEQYSVARRDYIAAGKGTPPPDAS